MSTHVPTASPRPGTDGYGRPVDLSGPPVDIGLVAAGPVLLLPVRLETHFVTTTLRREVRSELWIRIFPDQISVDSHDPSLTKAEWAASLRYWGAMWKLLPTQVDEQHAAWADLASAFGPRRAAYVAQATSPAGFDAWISSGTATPLGQGKPFAPKTPDTLRATSWEMTPMARALPVRWLVALHSNGVPVMCTIVDRPKQDLAVGPTPPAVGDATAVPNANMKWMFDFETALQAGMAVKIAIPPDRANNGFDQVVVVGISEGDPAPGSKIFERLITSHRFTDGFALITQGTPTKNSSDAKAGYSRKDDNYATSFALERRAALIDAKASSRDALRDGHFFADLLGINRSAVAHIAKADGMDQQDALNMMNVLWPVTGGYSIPYIFRYNDVPLQDLRQFLTSYVRPRGPIPAIRVGTVPYGVLPVMSIQPPIQATPWSSVLVPLANLVNAAVPLWLKSLKDPAPNRAAPEEALGDVLTLDATSCRMNAALCFGPFLQWNLSRFTFDDEDPSSGLLAVAYENAYNSSVGITEIQLNSLGWPKQGGYLRGLVLQMIYGHNLRLVTSDDFVSETDLLPDSSSAKGNYLRYFEGIRVTDLLKNGNSAGPATLLFRLLLQSVLLEYAAVAGTVLKTPLVELEYFPKGPARRNVKTFIWALQNLQFTLDPGAPPANGLPLGDYIHMRLGTTQGRQQYPTLASIFASLSALAIRPTAALRRVLLETLDLWTYRLDAWWTGLATAALTHFRAGAASGVCLGVYGYVENLKPDAPQGGGDVLPGEVKTLTKAKLGGRDTGLTDPLPPKPDNHGFVYAPSLAQAVTAAVLRNGYLTHRSQSNAAAYAIDLSSVRVRRALQLMEGVRQGQHLGALLGYQFEMSLLQSFSNIAQYIAAFRNLYPIVANKLTESGPAESVAASNVVDGAALQQAWFAGKIPWGDNLPAVGSTDYKAITIALDLLNDAVDAVSDLTIAETVFQIVLGNHVRAGGALDTGSRDQHAPELQVIETPRGGLDFTQRLLSVFAVDRDNPPRSSWLATATSPRTAAEPYLEQWLAAVLPNPSAVKFQVSFTLPGGQPTKVTLSLNQVGLSALDLVTMTPAAADPGKKPLSGSEMTGSELERWIIAQSARSGGPIPIGATNVSMVYGRDVLTDAPLVIPELLLLTRALKELLGAARPLSAADLVSPAAQSDLPSPDTAQLSSRMQAAMTAFGTLIQSLDKTLDNINKKNSSRPPVSPTAADADAISHLLLTAAAFGEPGAAPVTIARDAGAISVLLQQASNVRSRLDKRWNDMHGDLFDKAGKSLLTAGATLAVVREAAQDLFGKEFMILPTYTPVKGDSLDTALGDAKKARADWQKLSIQDRLNAAVVLQQMTSLHPSAARTDSVINLTSLIQSRASGQAVPIADLAVAQLPYDAALPWLGISKPPGQFPWDSSAHGKCALLTWMPGTLADATGDSVCGLMFDEWVERIPNDSERTAAAFHYEEPTTRAPQTLLLAVAPPGKSWSGQLLLQTVRETMQFSKVRTVDPEALQGLGQVVPAIYCAYSADGSTISTDFLGLSGSESS